MFDRILQKLFLSIQYELNKKQFEQIKHIIKQIEMDKNYSPILRPKRQRYNRENGKKNRNYGTRDIIKCKQTTYRYKYTMFEDNIGQDFKRRCGLEGVNCY